MPLYCYGRQHNDHQNHLKHFQFLKVALNYANIEISNTESLNDVEYSLHIVAVAFSNYQK